MPLKDELLLICVYAQHGKWLHILALAGLPRMSETKYGGHMEVLRATIGNARFQEVPLTYSAAFLHQARNVWPTSFF